MISFSQYLRARSNQWRGDMARIWRRKSNGVYYAIYYEDTRPHWHSLKTREYRIARQRFNNFKRDLQAGKIKPISQGIRQTWNSFKDEFLDHISATATPSTYRLYSVALNKASRCWGDVPLPHITIRHIERLVQDMALAGLATPTINKNYRHVKAALRKAHEWGYLVTPVRFPRPLKEEKTLRYLTRQQLAKLMDKITDQEFADFCMISAYTGLRSGELIRLRRSDIDNPSGFLRIESKRKNKQEIRVPINKSTRTILDRCIDREGRKLFRFNTRTWISQKFKAYARQAGLPDIRFHDLRHTFGSHMAMTGESLKAIQELMGHVSISSTMIYAKVSPEYLKAASEKLNYGPIPLSKKQ